MVFPKAKLFQEGGENIDEDIETIKKSLLQKEGIVGEDSEKDFRFFVGNCMSVKALDQIGGNMNSFNKRSFRLD